MNVSSSRLRTAAGTPGASATLYIGTLLYCDGVLHRPATPIITSATHAVHLGRVRSSRMEYVVQLVPAQDCHVALPRSLIQLLSSASDFPPVPLYLELCRTVQSAKSSSDPQPRQVWHLAWMGVAASGTDLEVSRDLGDCIGLSSGCSVKIRVRKSDDIAAATAVAVEPDSSDDWEALELNQSYLEEQILTQVAVLSKGQRFPVWIRRQSCVTLRVTSTSPKSVVRLTNGTELIVAPKDRKLFPEKAKTLSKGKERSPQSMVEILLPSFWLRVQDFASQVNVEGGRQTGPIISRPACYAYVSHGTASKCHLVGREWVTVTVPNVRSAKQTSDATEDSSREASVDVNDESVIQSLEDGVGRQRRWGQDLTVQIRISDDVAMDHIGLPAMARFACGARLLTPVRIQTLAGSGSAPVPPPPVLYLSPLVLERHTGRKGEAGGRPGMKQRKVEKEWERHRKLLSLACGTAFDNSKAEDAHEKRSEGAKALVLSWCVDEKAPVVDQVVVACHRREEYDNRGSEGLLEGEVGSGMRRLLKQEGQEREEELTSLFLLSLTDPRVLDKEKLGAKGGIMMWGSLREGLVSGQVSVQLASPCLRQFEEADRWQGVAALSTLSWLHAPAESSLTHLRGSLSAQAVERRKVLGTSSPGGVLLVGAQASGKSQLASAIARELREDATCLAYPVYIRCGDLVGEHAKVVRMALQEGVGEAKDNAPAVVVLDDVDVLMPPSKEGETGGSALVEFLGDMIDSIKVEGSPPVAFLALARNANSVAPELQISGRLDCLVELPAPAESERAAILAQVLERRHLSYHLGLVASVAATCQGYDASDMEVLVDRAVHAAAAQYLNTGQVSPPHSAEGGVSDSAERRVVVVEKRDFEKAAEGFVPVLMRGLAQMPTSGGQEERGWGDVGGLAEVQKAMREVLELPAQHSKIFATAPLRLRSGVLLYGPPGCGKTHIASSAAAACGLRLISVKGPELLNKYIGASEQAVRDVFAKAQVASPCILFFDEFDAIAPKRGHDNTGVTDRVVNQLLTELDGVEGLTGVFVLAATSRPDLIDAALLRPGRLDRLLFCDFPDEGERVDILKALAKSLPMGEGVDLGEVASQVAGFSGADLQALLGEAQVAAVHELLEEGTSSSGESKVAVITKELLDNAVRNARPSLPGNERMRLQAIYDNFLNGKSVSKSELRGKRSTLA